MQKQLRYFSLMASSFFLSSNCKITSVLNCIPYYELQLLFFLRFISFLENLDFLEYMKILKEA